MRKCKTAAKTSDRFFSGDLINDQFVSQEQLCHCTIIFGATSVSRNTQSHTHTHYAIFQLVGEGGGGLPNTVVRYVSQCKEMWNM